MTDTTPQVLSEVQSGDALGLARASKLFPGTQTANPRPETLFRWCTSGARSADGTRIKLEHIRSGARIVTSAAAVQRFILALTNGTSDPTPAPRTPAARAKAVEKANRKLIEMGA